mgnify:FL=1
MDSKEGGRAHGNLKPKVFETHTQIKLNKMKVNHENIMDVELVDYTSLYLDGPFTNPQQTYTTLPTFCTVLGATINWNKLVGSFLPCPLLI